MSNNKNQFYKGLFWGTILGVGAGALAGILFAPSKGSETRSKLKEKINELIEGGLELSAETLASLQNQEADENETNENKPLNEAKISANEIVNEAKNLAANLIIEANAILKEAKANQGSSSIKTNGFKG